MQDEPVHHPSAEPRAALGPALDRAVAGEERGEEAVDEFVGLGELAQRRSARIGEERLSVALHQVDA